jgi:amino acid transporter
VTGEQRDLDGPPRLVEPVGREQQLNRSLTTIGNIALTLSDITPSASLLVVGPVVIGTAGTGSLWAYLIGCFIALNVALCMGELGSMFPAAGGLYSIVTRVLGRPIGLVALFDYVGQAIFLPASMAIGIGTYVTSLDPRVPTNWVAAGTMIVVTLVGLLRIHFNAIMTGVFLTLELSVVVILFLAGIVHPHQSLSILTHPVIPHGDALTPVAAGVIMTALATALFSVNGYDSALNFSEETEGAASHIGRAVVVAASVGVFCELVPFTFALIGARDLHAVLSSSTPLTDVIGDAFGHTVVMVVTVGAIIAIFNASLAITLQFARVVWSSGRDRAWPEPVSTWLAQVNRYGSPWVATLLVGGLATALCFEATLVSVVTFTAVLIVVLYALTAIASLWDRMRQRALPRPFRMPFWPIPPLVSLVGVAFTLTQQKASDLWTVLAILGGAIVYYLAFLRRRSDRYWIPHRAVGTVDTPGAGGSPRSVETVVGHR